MEDIEIECCSLGQDAFAKLILNIDNWLFEVYETPIYGGKYSLSKRFESYIEALKYLNSLS